MVHILFLATSALLTAIAPWCDMLREAGGAPDDWVRARCPSVAAAPAGVPFDFFEATGAQRRCRFKWDVGGVHGQALWPMAGRYELERPT